MKKLVTLMLIASLSAGCLVGCGGSNSSNEVTNQETEITDATSTEVTTEEVENNAEENVETVTEEAGVVILDDEYVTVKRIKLWMNDERIYIKHNIENKTDHDICYYYSNLKVNGEEGRFGEPDIIEAGQSIEKINAVSKDNNIFKNISYSNFDNLEYQIWIFDATNFVDTSERDVVQWFMGNEEITFNAEELTLAKGDGFASLTNMPNPNELKEETSASTETSNDTNSIEGATFTILDDNGNEAFAVFSNSSTVGVFGGENRGKTLLPAWMGEEGPYDLTLNYDVYKSKDTFQNRTSETYELSTDIYDSYEISAEETIKCGGIEIYMIEYSYTGIGGASSDVVFCVGVEESASLWGEIQFIDMETAKLLMQDLFVNVVKLQ
ncbi:MAG: hypothetical protein IKW30_10995 [Lachnospiraceae bacterium]|nr:hypothetical protein [Lachnospiraceae bacterium]